MWVKFVFVIKYNIITNYEKSNYITNTLFSTYRTANFQIFQITDFMYNFYIIVT